VQGKGEQAGRQRSGAGTDVGVAAMRRQCGDGVERAGIQGRRAAMRQPGECAVTDRGVRCEDREARIHGTL